MGPFGAQTRATCLAVLAVTLALALASAGVRLLPWVLDARVPWATAWVFGRGLLAAAGETSAAMALPLGYALAAASTSDRGDARACLSVGASPLALALKTWPLAAAVATLALVLGLLWGGPRAEPLTVVRDLVAASRGACGGERRVADVPGAGAAWLCASEGPPRIAAISGDAVVLAERVAFEAGRVELAAVTLALRGPPELRLRAGEAVIVGLGTFDAPAGAPGRSRGIALVLGAACAALAVMAALTSQGEARRTVAAALGASTAALPFALAAVIERGHLAAPWLVTLPLAALAPAATYVAGAHLQRARRRAALREDSLGGRG